jgi:hypothetical protein
VFNLEADHEQCTSALLLKAVRGDEDQLLRATAAQWLAEVAKPQVLAALLALSICWRRR